MKRLIALILTLVCVLGLAGCNASHPVARVGQIDDDVKELTIVHTIGGTQTEWQVNDEVLKDLRDWSVKRDYQSVEFEAGHTPGDSNGNESYHFFMTGDTLPNFSYIINGEDKHYLWVEGNWYSVSNPAIPPVTEPADIVSFRAKVVEVKDNYLLVEPLADSNESKSADKIEVPLAGKTSWPVPAVGDTVNMFYSGGIQETYPARITKVHRVEIETTSAYTCEELSEMPAKELLDLFIQNGLVINDDLKASFTEEELQALFKENFHLWHTGVSAHSHTMYIDLAEQTKAIFDKIAE